MVHNPELTTAELAALLEQVQAVFKLCQHLHRLQDKQAAERRQAQHDRDEAVRELRASLAELGLLEVRARAAAASSADIARFIELVKLREAADTAAAQERRNEQIFSLINVNLVVVDQRGSRRRILWPPRL